MSFVPAQYLGHAVVDLVGDLAQLPADALPPLMSSEVEMCSTSPTLAEAVTVRPASLLGTTCADADLPTDHPDITLPGVVLERYLGGGGQGWVYVGRVTETGKTLAVKVLRASSERSSRNLALHEAVICSRLRHPNILRVFQAVEAGSFWVVLMELVQGRELNRDDIQDCFRSCFGQLASALLELQRQQIVHRDIKPGNVLLRHHNLAPVLVDFGLAQDLNVAKEVEAVSGTPVFMAPETFSTSLAHPAQDAYSLGVTAAVLLTGMPRGYLWLSDLHLAKLTGSFDEDLRRRIQRVSDVDLRDWILDLIAPEPERRLEAVQRAATWAQAA